MMGIADNPWLWTLVFLTSVAFLIYNSLTYGSWPGLLFWDGFFLFYAWISGRNIVHLRDDPEEPDGGRAMMSRDDEGDDSDG